MKNGENSENKKDLKKDLKRKKNMLQLQEKYEYLETYKNQPCYNLLIKCPLCNVERIKASDNLHLKSKKHILNKEAYEITFKRV